MRIPWLSREPANAILSVIREGRRRAQDQRAHSNEEVSDIVGGLFSAEVASAEEFVGEALGGWPTIDTHAKPCHCYSNGKLLAKVEGVGDGFE